MNKYQTPTRICRKCQVEFVSWCLTCEPCQDAYVRRDRICEKIDCTEKGIKSVYGPGYHALVCEAHYDSTQSSSLFTDAS